MAETLFHSLDGAPGCRKLAAALYARVDSEPNLRPFFPGKTHKCAIEEFAAFLTQFLDGPPEHSQRRWWLSLRESHARFRIEREHRDAWLRCMTGALDDAGLPESVHTALHNFFLNSSAYLVNHGPPPAVHEETSEELARRWQFQQDLDEAVAAVRRVDVRRALTLAQSYQHQSSNLSAFARLLAVMIGSGRPELLQFVHESIRRDPSLVVVRQASRTLLYEAAAKGAATTVDLLLKLGADPNVRDGGGHTPLYAAGNECGTFGGAAIVHLLVAAGADVNADDGVKHCTALHMAARRDSAEIAQALLDCGANIEARDSLGHTPLRRAVNLNQIRVAALLLARGADPHSRCKKGLTSQLAARGPAMKQLLTAESSRSAG